MTELGPLIGVQCAGENRWEQPAVQTFFFHLRQHTQWEKNLF